MIKQTSDFNIVSVRANHLRISGLIKGFVKGIFRLSPEAKAECLTWLVGMQILVENDRSIAPQTKTANTIALADLTQVLNGRMRFTLDSRRDEVLAILADITGRYSQNELSSRV